MKITSSVEYAARLMMTLAREHGKAPMTAERLAKIDNVPSDYVSQLLLKLRRAGLVVSQRGTSGGYSLSQAPETINLSQIVRAAGGEMFGDVCGRYSRGTKDCRHQGNCGLSSAWNGLSALVADYLEKITLAQLVERTPALQKIGG